MRIEPTNSEVKGACFDDYATNISFGQVHAVVIIYLPSNLPMTIDPRDIPRLGIKHAADFNDNDIPS